MNMNLSSLFEMQRELDERIVKEKGLEGRDLLPEKILALQVELGECANEWRGFKFWSKDQEPRREVKCHACRGTGTFVINRNLKLTETCAYCGGTGIQDKDRLLEEYIDCLHFILSIGNEIGYDYTVDSRYLIEHNIGVFCLSVELTEKFSETFRAITEFSMDSYNNDYELYEDIGLHFFALGRLLGFTWEQIESAYKTKWEINQQRQTNGY